MTKGGFSQAWESSQHLRAARLEADIDWLFSVIGDPKAHSQSHSELHSTKAPPRLNGFAARLQEALGLHPPAK